MKHFVPICIVLVLGVTLAACTVSAGSLGAVAPVAAPEPTSTTSSASAQASPSIERSPSIEPAPSPEASPVPFASGTTIVRAYFILDGPVGSAGLVPVLREIPATKAVARGAMNALLDGPTADEPDASPAISSSIPAGTELLGLSIKDGVATVDLSGEFEIGGGSASCLGRLSQVVYTLTQFSSVDSVAFRVEGRPVSVFGCEGIVLDEPVGRGDPDDPSEPMFEGLLPAIFVDGPAWGAALDNPGRVTGTANTYEAWLMVSLYDASGRQLYESPAQATCGTGCRGTFDVTLAYVVSEPQWGTLRVLDGDESGATDGVIREYPVWLTPGSLVESEHHCGC